MRKCKIAIIGINGFGAAHLGVAEKLQVEGLLEIRAVCETNQGICTAKINELKKAGVNIYTDYIDMLDHEKEIDFVAVSTPINLHKEMAIRAMDMGFNVLLEKPPAVTIQDIDAIIAASKRNNRLCAVDFMHTADKGFLELLDRIRTGQLGQIKTIKGKGLWKRLDSYYERTPWAGKLVHNHHYVLDGTINNPLAHLLNNMLFVAATTQDFTIKAVTAELYHAHNIEGEDTSCIRIEGVSGLELFFFATLCNDTEDIPEIRVEGTDGFTVWNYESELEINCKGSSEKKKYGNDNNFDKVYHIYVNLCKVVTGETDKLLCSIDATRNFVLASNGAFESSCKIHEITSHYIERYSDGASYATRLLNIKEIIDSSYAKGKLFSDNEVTWAKAGKHFQMDGYEKFEMFAGQ